jgi:hypothetical protein
MPEPYTFAAVAKPQDVTDLLRNNKASKARVAAVGQEDPAKRFNVWYVPTQHSKNWQFKEIPFDKTGNTDTDDVTTTLNKSDLAAVAFLGQAPGPGYFVWWLE